MKKLTESEFTEFFDKNIAPQINEFEGKRKNLLKKLNWITGITALVLVALFLFTQTSSSFFWEIGIVIVAIIIGGVFCSNYRNALKTTFYPKLFGQLELNYSNSYNSISHGRSQIRTICDASRIFYRYDNIDVDDVITGDYNGLPISVYDSKISYETGSGKHRHTVVPFNGIFIGTKINKKLNCETVIKMEKNFSNLIKTGTGMSVSVGAGVQISFGAGSNGMEVEKYRTGNINATKKERVQLEDVEFEKVFEVYSEDQVEGRYLLTPSFMNRLLEYKNKKHYGIELFFSNRLNSQENTFMFIHNNKDNFELPIFKKIEKDSFYNLIKEIYDALEIIDALKLEQDIGL